jgi:hypothetical protein
MTIWRSKETCPSFEGPHQPVGITDDSTETIQRSLRYVYCFTVLMVLRNVTVTVVLMQ